MAIFDVSTLADSGPGSLREAIASANATLGADTITFQSSVTGTITLTTGQIGITDSVTIDGPGAGVLAVSGNDASRVFYVYNPAPAPIDVTISGLTLTDGRSLVLDDTVASRGGAINAVGENLTIEDSVVQDSMAAGDGGGIASTGAALTIRDTVVRLNDAFYRPNPMNSAGQGGDGGGVFANGSTGVLVDTVSFYRNESGLNGGAVQISAPQNGAEILIVDSTLDENMAGGTQSENTDHVGGGFAMESVPAFTIRRSTISGNVTNYGGAAGGRIADSQGLIESSTISEGYAQGPGGGLGVEDSTVTISHTTLGGNFTLGNPNTLGNGIHAIASTVDISNTIIANLDGPADLVTVGGATIALRYSYVRFPGTATIQDNGGNILNPSPFTPVLGDLQDNGGPTHTQLPRGVVVNAGDPAFSPPPSTDQRGLPRVNGGRIDMGAVELHAGTIQFETDATSINEHFGTVVVTLTRTGGTDGVVFAMLTGVPETATAPSDYNTPSPMLVSWLPNDATPQALSPIAIHNDDAYEGDETFRLEISSVTGGAAIGAPATHTVTIIDTDPAPADLSLSKTIAEPGPYMAGQTITFNIVVTNAGPGGATNVVVTDFLPAGLRFLSATPDVCTGESTLLCSLGTLFSGETATLAIRTRLEAAGELTNGAGAGSSSPEANTADNDDTVTFAVAPADLAAVPALDPTMQVVLAALIAAVAIAVVGRR